MNHVEAKTREALSSFLASTPWQLFMTGRISRAEPLEAIDQRAHDFLHRMEGATGLQLVGIGLAIREQDQGHVHLLASPYAPGGILPTAQADLDHLASLWTNGTRAAQRDCRIEVIHDLPGVCSYISGRRNFTISEASLSGKQTQYILFGHRRLERFMKRCQR